MDIAGVMPPLCGFTQSSDFPGHILRELTKFSNEADNLASKLVVTKLLLCKELIQTWPD